MIPISKSLLGEEEKKAVIEVLDSGLITQGPRVGAFEAAFAEMCGVKYAIATTSGTTALHVVLMALGIGEGDEVITTPFTFIATGNSIVYSGARPVFVDIDPDTYNIDPAKIPQVITPKTKAIMPVHLYGLCCDMDPILEIAEEHGLHVIEDACQAPGGSYKGRRAGSFGIGVFSLYQTKNITSGEGGMITTNDPVFAEKCRIARQHGMVKRYYHAEFGFNFRMSDIHAAVGLAQLQKLETFNQKRRENARFLSSHLEGVKIPVVPEGYDHVFHQYTIRVDGSIREELRTYLLENGIEADVYYPVPIHKQIFYSEELTYKVSMPQSELAANEVLSLPVHPGLSQEDLEKITETVNAFIHKKKERDADKR